MAEGNSINKSLTVLGRVIKALVDVGKQKGRGKTFHVPFRESVLTWYLRESLSGNARTTMIANVSPAASNREETLSTLRYATVARKIQTKAVVNEDPLKAKVRELTDEVERLKKLLATDRRRSTGGRGVAIWDPSDVASMKAEERSQYMEELQRRMRLLGGETGGTAEAAHGGDFGLEDDDPGNGTKAVFHSAQAPSCHHSASTLPLVHFQIVFTLS